MYVYIRHCTHPGVGTIAIATTSYRTGSHVRTCTSCRVAGEWRSVHVRTTELKKRMSTVLDKCTLLTYNNMTTTTDDYFIHYKTTGSIGGNINQHNKRTISN